MDLGWWARSMCGALESCGGWCLPQNSMVVFHCIFCIFPGCCEICDIFVFIGAIYALEKQKFLERNVR